MKEDELLEEITQWIVTSCKSQLPYTFHAKEIAELCKEHYRDVAVKAANSLFSINAYGTSEDPPLRMQKLIIKAINKTLE